MQAQIANYGGAVVSLTAPDRHGRWIDAVLGFDTLVSYLTPKPHPYLGVVVGRYGNRIANGRFTLNGVAYVLAQNNGLNHLHGGINGFDRVVWQARSMSSAEGPRLEMAYLSKDGEEGYPGNLSVTLSYTLTSDNALKIAYDAITDKDTVLNLTNHSYFNLAGAAAGDILGHEIQINADYFTPVTGDSIPTGELRAVKGTPMDFTRRTAIGLRIGQDDEQLAFGGGYDHNWVLNDRDWRTEKAVELYEPATGRVMEVYTSEPGVQLYTGNNLAGNVIGRGGITYHKHQGLCLETQHFPDSPHHPHFPCTVLRSGERYTSTTIYKFLASYSASDKDS
jgi:aldose 1-epimerase